MAANMYDTREWVHEHIDSKPQDRFEEERLRRVLAAIPDDVTSVLDIGIGGGYVYGKLKARQGLRCAGIDISMEVVKRVRDDSVLVADAKALPFKDGGFDLVLSADVVEHIEGDDSFRASVAEMARVAGRYIVLNSPYKDSVHWPVARCNSCGREFNVYGHMRRIDAGTIKRMFPAEKFEVVRLRTFGGKREWRPEFMVAIARRWGKVYSRDGVVCPGCLKSDVAPPQRNAFERLFANGMLFFFKVLDRLIPRFLKSDTEMCVVIRKR